MPAVYLSHAMPDAAMAGRLRDALARRGAEAEADEGRMNDRAALPARLLETLARCAGLVVLASPAACASPQVRAEVQHLIEQGHRDAIAVIAWGQSLDALAAAWPELAALGAHALPTEPTAHELDRAAYLAVAATRIGPRLPGELIIDFDDFRVEGERVCARVWVGDQSGEFEAPLGPIEAGELQWYLESYYKWPSDAFEARARQLEQQLPNWGAALWFALVKAGGSAVADWLRETASAERLLTLRMASPRPVPITTGGAEGVAASVSTDATTKQLVLAQIAATRQMQAAAVDERPPEVIEQHAAENAAQARFLALPWGMLASDGQYLFNKDPAVALRRVMVPREPMRPLPERQGPIKVLVIVARPDKAGLIDPRASADALIDAVAPLGEAVELTFLRPPTLDGLARALTQDPHQAPFDVLHFDGHGVYDARTGLGYLCFEHRDPQKRAAGEPELIDGAEIRKALGDQRLPLAFLEACQTAQSDETSDAAMASALLAAGAESVIAMSHSVLVTTATRFTAAFYDGLIHGQTVAAATARGRRALIQSRARGSGQQPHALELDDWHVPLLYQRGEDPTLVRGGTARHGHRGARQRARRHRTLPRLERHRFVGRLRERLDLERALEAHPRAVIIGMGGQGKTTLAAELGRWLVRCERFKRAAFVSVEAQPPVAAVANTIGRALIGDDFTVAGADQDALDAAIDTLGDWLERHPGLIVIDNLETLLPPPAGAPEAEQWTHRPELLAGVLELAAELSERGQSRVIITCREPIPDPRFQRGRRCHVQTLGGLPTRDAIALVGEICRNEGARVDPGDDAALPAMVQAVGGHPRSLVLLPALLRTHGVRAVATDLRALMTELEARHPGARERSLLASVRLSLRRLPTRWRALLPPLGVLRVGASTPAMVYLLEQEPTALNALAEALAERGLVHIEAGRNYLRFHPALAAVLADDLRAAGGDPALAAARARAVAVYQQVVRALYGMWNGPQHALATRLTGLELPNLLWVLDALVDAVGPDGAGAAEAIDYATGVEGLLQNTPHRRALAGVAQRRAAVDQATGEAWTHARHIAAGAAIDRLLEAGQVAAALPAAEAAVAHAARAAAAEAFPEAGYDHAHALWKLGRVREMAGQPAAALAAIDAARAGFAALPGDGAARMASVCLTEGATCLVGLGRYDAAAARYEQAIEEFGRLDDARSVAVTHGQIAMVRLQRGDLTAALTGYQQARDTFAALGEPGVVAQCWHQIGMVLQDAKRYAEAEGAYKQSVAIRLDRGERVGAAETMHELASNARGAGRLEEAVRWGKQAADIFHAANHRLNEGRARGNLAITLHSLGRLTAAQAEAQAVAELMSALGLAAEPWKAWGILHDIARDAGDPTAAAEARAKAIEAYRGYRLQGGEPTPEVKQLFGFVAQALAAGQGSAIADMLETAITEGQFNNEQQALTRALAACARGDTAAAYAALLTVDYDKVVELELLLAGHWPHPPQPATP